MFVVLALSVLHELNRTRRCGPGELRDGEGDLRVLESEEAHIVQQVAEGASAITSAGLVVGILTRTEREKLRVATGAYDEAIDNRIEQIKLI